MFDYGFHYVRSGNAEEIMVAVVASTHISQANHLKDLGVSLEKPLSNCLKKLNFKGFILLQIVFLPFI